MKLRFTAVLSAASAAALILAAGAGAEMIGIYRNGMEGPAQRAQMIKLTGRNCTQRGIGQEMQITLGKNTNQCTYRTPVVGRQLEVAASEKLLSTTPKGLQRKVYLGLVLRTGGGEGYELAVFPAQQKVQLRKNLPGGKVKYLAINRGQKSVQPINKTNQLSLQAIDVSSGPERGQCRIFAFAGENRSPKQPIRTPANCVGARAGWRSAPAALPPERARPSITSWSGFPARSERSHRRDCHRRPALPS